MRLEDEEATLALGGKLARNLRTGDVVTFSGALSAGKTTLVRGILKSLGHGGDVPSPSFAIVQPYELLQPPVWHVDLYRIENLTDLIELGLDEVRSEGVLLVEWPEHGASNAWPDALALSLKVDEQGARVLTAQVPASWEGRWPPL